MVTQPPTSPLPGQTPGAPVPTINHGAQTVEDAVQHLLKDGETAAEAAIIAAAPVMGTPIWKQIWEAFFDWLFKFLTQPLAVYSGRVIITLEEHFILKAAVAAQVNLDAIKKTGDPDGIAKASRATDAAVAAAIQYIGATHT